MTKAEMIEQVSFNCGLTKQVAQKAVETVFSAMKVALKEGENVSYSGFGTFSVFTRKERKGRNPKTGEILVISSSKTVKFKAGQLLKSFVNGEVKNEF
ncbi:MAG: integration host factor subunit alpha [Magnetococcus sp. WYHC-3]